MLLWVTLLTWLICGKVSFGQDVSVPLIGGCEQVKFFYQDGIFNSSYVLKDIDTDVMDEGCVDSCVYLKVNGGDSEFCFESSPEPGDEATTEYRLPCHL